jgi:hypothetical protein
MGLSYWFDTPASPRKPAPSPRIEPLRRRIGACAAQLLAKNFKERKASRTLNTQKARFFRLFHVYERRKAAPGVVGRGPCRFQST